MIVQQSQGGFVRDDGRRVVRVPGAMMEEEAVGRGASRGKRAIV